MKKINILIVGASGFVGSNLLNYIDNINFNIISLSRKKIITKKKIKSYKFTSLKKLFLTTRIDCVVNCLTSYSENKYESKISNYILPKKIYFISSKHNVKLFINIDTCYKKIKNKNYRLFYYRKFKEQFSNFLLKNNDKDLKATNCILYHVYGGNEKLSKFIPKIIDDLYLSNKKKVLLTKGEQKRDFIYVDDVSSFIKKIIIYFFRKKLFFNQIDIGTCKQVSIKNFIKTLINIKKTKKKIIFGAIKYQPGELFTSKASNKNYKKIGFKSQYTLKTGLKKTLNYYLNK